MNTCSPVNLQPNGLRSQSYLRERLGDGGRCSMFRNFLVKGCVPVHIPKEGTARVNSTVTISPSRSAHGCCPSRLRIPRALKDAAEGKDDRLILTVKKAELINPDDISIVAECATVGELDVMKKQPLKEIAACSAYRLESNINVIAMEGARNILVMRRQNKMLKPSFDEDVPADSMVGDHHPSRIWSTGVAAKLSTLEVTPLCGIQYLGAAVDARVSHVFNLIGLAETYVTPSKIANGFKGDDIETVPLRLDDMLAWLERERSRMTPQLITSITFLCYRFWGSIMVGEPS